MSPPGRAESRRPGQGTGPQKMTTAAVPTSVTEQPTLSGIDRAIANSDPWQLSTFLHVIENLPAGRVFMTEDVLDSDFYGLPMDHHNRAGAWTAHAARAGLIERIGYAPAKKASRAGGISAVWRRCRDGE
jgi:hypothetical protein